MKANNSILGAHTQLEAAAITAARCCIASIMEFGVSGPLDLSPEVMPTPELVTAAAVARDARQEGRIGWCEVVEYAVENTEGEAEKDTIRALIADVATEFPTRPEVMQHSAALVMEYHNVRQRQHLAWRLKAALEAGEEIDGLLAEIAALGTAAPMHSMIVQGVNSFPTITPPETVILGNGWIRRGDIATIISTAGAGKSVIGFQAGMAWGLGLPYLGIRPSHPLRVLIFSGEDDPVTVGQCREGFLEHSEAVTGRQLTAADLQPLDEMLRTEFSREHVGLSFHAHLSALLTESPADLVIINPLLSYIGGEIVANVSEWLRGGIMPILQRHDCAALIAHHTGKMAKDGWDNTDDVYSAIGGGEVANIPRTILTLRPTPAEGLSVVKVSKRQTTGWQDETGAFTPCYFVKRSDNPERPAWLPVNHGEALDLISDSKAAGVTARGKKATPAHVVQLLQAGAVQRQALIENLMAACKCSDRPARDAIIEAINQEAVVTFTERNPRGGNPLQWLCLPQHQKQWVA